MCIVKSTLQIKLTWLNISYAYSETVTEEGDGESEQSQTKEGKDGKVDIVYYQHLGE